MNSGVCHCKAKQKQKQHKFSESKIKLRSGRRFSWSRFGLKYTQLVLHAKQNMKSLKGAKGENVMYKLSETELREAGRERDRTKDALVCSKEGLGCVWLEAHLAK